MQFKAGGTQLFASARQANDEAVTRNYAASPSEGPQSDQTMIWNKVAGKRAALSVGPESGPMHEAYAKYEGDINDYIKHFRTIDGQVGALFAINGVIIGADIFDKHQTCEKLFPKLVKSYALDAIASRDAAKSHAAVTARQAREFLHSALAKGVSVSDYASPGEGRDVRIKGTRINGSSLVDRGTPVHIALFALAEEADSVPASGPDSGIGPIIPATQRRILRQ